MKSFFFFPSFPSYIITLFTCFNIDAQKENEAPDET